MVLRSRLLHYSASHKDFHILVAIPTAKMIFHSIKWPFTKALTEHRSGFAYRSLHTEQIRLVVLLPGSTGSRIECRLLHQKTYNPMQYDALSYTWGDMANTEEIMLNGFIFTVTAGLERALRHLRLPNKKRVLWIDAICINQMDTTERNHQVQMMFNIYQNAQAVRAWIGCEIGDEDQTTRNELDGHMSLAHNTPGNHANAMPLPGDYQHDWDVWKLIDIFGNLDAEAEWSTSSERDIFSLVSNSFKLPSGQKAWHDLAILVLRPYWTRVWIQQEILIKSKVIVHCGSASFPLLSLCGLYELLKRYLYSLDDYERHHSCAAFIHQSCLQIMNLKSQEKNLVQPDVTTMMQLLRYQSLRQTTDPRDKIYGVVGLVRVWRNGGLPVDYGLSVRHVYAMAFKYTVEQYQRLHILVHQARTTGAQRLAELPSWCPDWNHNVDLPNAYHVKGDRIIDYWKLPANLPLGASAAGNSSARVSWANDYQILKASGVVLDVIESLTGCFNERGSFASHTTSAVFRYAMSLAKRFSGGPYWSYWQSKNVTTVVADHEKHLITTDLQEARSTCVSCLTSRSCQTYILIQTCWRFPNNKF
jgi:hypothetical protein